MVPRIDSFGPQFDLMSFEMRDRNNALCGECPVLSPVVPVCVAAEVTWTAAHNQIPELTGGSWSAGIEVRDRAIRSDLAHPSDTGCRVQARGAVVDRGLRVAEIRPVV